MYFSLVKLFKWTFSDYASDYAMQVLHMQNLANLSIREEKNGGFRVTFRDNRQFLHV